MLTTLTQITLILQDVIFQVVSGDGNRLVTPLN